MQIYRNSRLLGCVTIAYIEPSSHYSSNWSPRVSLGAQDVGLYDLWR